VLTILAGKKVEKAGSAELLVRTSITINTDKAATNSELNPVAAKHPSKKRKLQ
jgi:hypothetical protein